MSLQTNRQKQQQGFTLIELMLSVVFIGFLLVTIALTIMQMMSLYNKGLTLKEVASVSRVVVRDMQQNISGADMFKLKYEDESNPEPGAQMVVASTLQEADEYNVDYYNNDAGGRLCTGVYSYIWNTGQALGSGGGIFGGEVPLTYVNPSNDDSSLEQYPIQFVHTQENGEVVDKPVRFVKKSDPAKELCKTPPGETADTTNFDQKIGSIEDYDKVFGNGDNNLMLYGFEISTPLGITDTNGETTASSEVTAISTYYNISLVIGTQMGDENQEGLLQTNSATCKAPDDADLNDSEYCAVNKVDFVVRTGRIAR